MRRSSFDDVLDAVLADASNKTHTLLVMHREVENLTALFAKVSYRHEFCMFHMKILMNCVGDLLEL